MSTSASLPAFITDGARPDAAKPVKATLRIADNTRARALFGSFDEHLAVVERMLHVDAVARGNTVVLTGSDVAVDQARRVLSALEARLAAGEEVETGDVEGAVRQVEAEGAQGELPAMREPERKPAAVISTPRKTIRGRTPTQDAYIRALNATELTFGIGPAGTGKTYLAVAHAAAQLERGAVDRIILSRPAVEAGERLGFLPGDMKEKVDPYLRPLYDALYDMMAPEKVERALTAGVIEIAPLAFMRGRTLAHAAIILDEAQNTTSMQMKMFLTRLGEGSRMIVTGDPSQVDLPAGQESGLVEAMRLLERVEGVSMIRFSAADVVRHQLVGRIVRAYEKAGKAGGL